MYKRKTKFYKKLCIWAFYRGDKFIDEGNFYELCDKLNLSMDTLYYYTSKSYKKRIKNFITNDYVQMVLIERTK